MGTLSLIGFFGGLLLMLYGMRMAGDGLQRAAGARLRGFLLNATSNRFKAVGVGAAMTALFQSSSASTVMLVGLVGSGLLGLTETMGVILGADIGTTLTVQLLAFRIYDYAIAFIGFGILLKLTAGKKGPAGNIGTVILGFGFVFLGLKSLNGTFEPMAQNPLLRDMLIGMGKDPLAGIIVSALLTALFQSSAVTLGIAITAAHSGLLTLDAAMPVVLGANIGTCVSALASSIGADIGAKRVAVSHVLFKATGVIIVLPFLGIFTAVAGLSATELTRQAANAHTFFNIGIAAIFLPFTGLFTRLVKLLMPESEAPEKFGPKYLDPLVLASPPLALVQASRECLRAADIVGDMLKRSIDVFEKNDLGLLEEIEEKDDYVDILDREIKLYLTRLTRESLSGEQAKRELEILLFSDNMENIGDVIDKNLMELGRKKIRDNLSFSREGAEEIRRLHSKVIENFELGTAAFAGSDAVLAQKLMNHKIKLSEMERELRQAHIERLRMGLKESIDTSSIHLDILTNLKRVNSYITNSAYPILERERQ
ncbi:MAG: Na/Pi cotransporter family protein [Deltaproteobacteria bacterium]|nr:Na/Pi cotransporter family protein [Deltaproteobacteria bacterium]